MLEMSVDVALALSEQGHGDWMSSSVLAQEVRRLNAQLNEAVSDFDRLDAIAVEVIQQLRSTEAAAR